MNLFIRYCIACCCAFSAISCSTTRVLSFDELQPAELTFSPEIRSVGIVNSVQPLTNEREVLKQDGVLIGDGNFAATQLSKYLADTKYFDEIILSEQPFYPKTNIITQADIDSLTQAMQVDMLVVINRLPIYLTPTEIMLPDSSVSFPVINSVCVPELQFYIAGQSLNQSFSYSRKDSVYIQQDVQINLNDIKRETTERACHSLIPVLVPTWTTSTRWFYAGRNSEYINDAMISLKEKDWAGAIDRCKHVYNTSKKATIRSQAAYNLAIINERINRIDDALIWIDLAAQNVQPNTTDATRIAEYNRLLNKRKAELPRLQDQMSRFAR